MSRPDGIRQRHTRTCKRGKRCGCPWQARVQHDGGVLVQTFPTQAAATAWRADQLQARRRGELRRPTATTVAEAAAALLAGMQDGSILDRSGHAYKPSAIRAYRDALEDVIVPAIGSSKLQAVERQDVQDIVADLTRRERKGRDGKPLLGPDGKPKRYAPQTIRNAIMPLRVIFRLAIDDGVVTVNPCQRLRLPANRRGRDRVESPATVAAILAALPDDLRPLWATAAYAGLRRGELRALRWGDVDMTAGTIRVERSMDDREGVVAPKSAAGIRTVPILAALRPYLDAHRLRTLLRTGADPAPERLVFASTRGGPFTPTNVDRRARKALRAVGLQPITLHELRHVAVSSLLAAGLDVKAAQTIAGHADARMTLDRYGHAMPGHLDAARKLADAYLADNGG